MEKINICLSLDDMIKIDCIRKSDDLVLALLMIKNKRSKRNLKYFANMNLNALEYLKKSSFTDNTKSLLDSKKTNSDERLVSTQIYISTTSDPLI